MYLEHQCRGCMTELQEWETSVPLEAHPDARSDHYGNFTGLYCNKCYNDSSKYTTRKDAYFDASYAGESMEAI
tara:strand:+ start:706 stop:924 length:219 start_codon:yes stop_codon:yes gene_type:complete